MHKNGFVILDFGSQYTQLIARRLREMDVFSEILAFDAKLEDIQVREPKGIILSGGPSSVHADGAPKRAVKELLTVAPVLGICYGMQLLNDELGGVVKPAKSREYGLTELNWLEKLTNTPKSHKVWMSHGDVVEKLAPDLKLMAQTQSGHPAVVVGDKVLGLQFHPEVTHSEFGENILSYYVFEMCQAQKNWKPSDILKQLKENILDQVGDSDHVLCALSGGVDSTVVATILTETLGAERVHCVFVDNGLLRKNEFQDVLKVYKDKLQLNIRGVEAQDQFLDKLKGVSDPEKKRKLIGHTFIEVFKDEIKKIGHMEWLAQGTLYPDVIESVSLRGQSVTIKSHHNVGGLPKDLNLKLVEPLRELFKDEVREIGKKLAIPDELLMRHPFPGPGLGIRVLGEVTKEKLDMLKEADAIYREELHASGLYSKIWQAFCVLLPVQSVGVQGDGRTYESALALRAVTSLDGMTADWFEFPHEFLKRVSGRITNEVQGINRVVYDITSKPPGTIEWE